jgi:glycosyltransferase involved in cell wall biosynthesis
MNRKARVSVMVPIYKVEQYIERCARSLFEQTLGEVEYIFVDDSSPDSSMAVLEHVIEHYPHRKPWVKIVRHPENRGLAAARNTALGEATADYAIFCDSDDWVDHDMYRLMWEKAAEAGSDIVHCATWAELPSGRIPDAQYKVLPEGRDMLRELRWKPGSLCNKMVRRSLYTDNGISSFPGLDMWEDGAMTMRLYLYAHNMSKVDTPLYHYNCMNPGSMSTLSGSTRRSAEQWVENARRVAHFFEERGEAREFAETLQSAKLSAKHGFLVKTTYRDLDFWRKTFPETHRGIWKTSLPRKQKLLYWTAAYGPKWLALLASDAYTAMKDLKNKNR